MKRFGYIRTKFTPDLWHKWLARLNTQPDSVLVAGIAEMRELLQSRCLGEMREEIEDTGKYRTFVARNFGTAK